MRGGHFFVLFFRMISFFFFFFFFNDTATTEIYTLSLHDALPILGLTEDFVVVERHQHTCRSRFWGFEPGTTDRKSTRLNSSHDQISYAVFCLKKKKPERNSIAKKHTLIHLRQHKPDQFTLSVYLV